MVDCEHKKDKIYNIWSSSKKTKLYNNELLRYYCILSNIPGYTKNVIDLGCGTGFMSHLLAMKGLEVTAIDKSSDRLSCFQDNIKNNNIRIENKDFFEFDEVGFDLLICQEVIEHITDYYSVFRKIYSYKGYAIITTPYKENLETKTKRCEICGEQYHTSGHLHSFDEKKLQEACIDNNFEIIKTLLIVNNRAIKFFLFYNIPVNSHTIIIDRIFNKLFPHKAAYLLVLIRKINL